MQLVGVVDLHGVQLLVSIFQDTPSSPKFFKVPLIKCFSTDFTPKVTDQPSFFCLASGLNLELQGGLKVRGSEIFRNLKSKSEKPFWSVAFGVKSVEKHLIRGTLKNLTTPIVCGARCRDPRTASRTTDAILDCAFVENALVFVVPKIGRARAPPSPPP